MKLTELLIFFVAGSEEKAGPSHIQKNLRRYVFFLFG